MSTLNQPPSCLTSVKLVSKVQVLDLSKIAKTFGLVISFRSGECHSFFKKVLCLEQRSSKTMSDQIYPVTGIAPKLPYRAFSDLYEIVSIIMSRFYFAVFVKQNTGNKKLTKFETK